MLPEHESARQLFNNVLAGLENGNMSRLKELRNFQCAIGIGKEKNIYLHIKNGPHH